MIIAHYLEEKRKGTMSLIEHLEDYKEDQRKAHRIYAEEIFLTTVYPYDGSPVPLTDTEIHNITVRARAMKAQASGAGTKRLKAAILLEHMDKLVNQFDMTYYLSVKIATRLIGRAIDRNKLFERYATTGREADKKTADIAPERFELITQSAPYIECENDLNEAYEMMDKIKSGILAEPEMKALTENVKRCLTNSLKANG